MILAKLLSKIFKNDGVILIDYSGQKYICGKPNLDKPLTIKLLKKNLSWKNNWHLKKNKESFEKK